MPSWQSYVVNSLLRLLVQRKLAKVSTTTEAREVLGRSFPVKIPDVEFVTGYEGGVEGEWACGSQKTCRIMLYLHGGGYFASAPSTYRRITGGFARQGFLVFAPDYRLAPEHPYPAAVDDALAAYRGLLATYAPEQIVVVGDSAGGGLALALILAARDAGLTLPAGLVLFSPWTDLAGTGDSLKTNAKRESLLLANRLEEVAALYLDGADPKTPTASPLYGDLSSLPPVLIQVSDQEILLNDSTRLAERIKDTGGQVELQIWENLPHVWQFNQSFLPEAREALKQAADFARRTLAQRAPTA